MSIVRRMDHFTIVTDKPEETHSFYADLGLRPGARPNFAVNGFCLYAAEGKPILHVIEVKTIPTPRRGAIGHMLLRLSKLSAWLQRLLRCILTYTLIRASD